MNQNHLFRLLGPGTSDAGLAKHEACKILQVTTGQQLQYLQVALQLLANPVAELNCVEGVKTKGRDRGRGLLGSHDLGGEHENGAQLVPQADSHNLFSIFDLGAATDLLRNVHIGSTRGALFLAELGEGGGAEGRELAIRGIVRQVGRLAEVQTSDDLVVAQRIRLAGNGSLNQGEHFGFTHGASRKVLEDLALLSRVLGQVTDARDGSQVERG